MLAGSALMVALVVRVIADTVGSLGWLRWVTPLGWAEELRPFAGAQAWVLILPVLASGGLLAGAGILALRRDIGAGLLPVSQGGRPRRWLLSSASAQALRLELPVVGAWVFGCGFFALIIGVLSTSISSAGLSASAQRELNKISSVSIVSPAGYVAFTFLFFVLAFSLFVCTQIAAARREEAEQRLETLLALPVGRARWLCGRLALAAGLAALLALATGLFGWVGEASQGAGISLPRMLEAALNCLPATLLFLGLGALAYAVVPRAAAGLAYGLVAIAFVWDLLGSLLGPPAWVLGLTPFQHVGLVPAQPFRLEAALVMLAITGGAASAAVVIFRRRDLTG
jgi:ABC-2 type transport system permease protein